MNTNNKNPQKINKQQKNTKNMSQHVTVNMVQLADYVNSTSLHTYFYLHQYVNRLKQENFNFWNHIWFLRQLQENDAFDLSYICRWRTWLICFVGPLLFFLKERGRVAGIKNFPKMHSEDTKFQTIDNLNLKKPVKHIWYPLLRPKMSWSIR